VLALVQLNHNRANRANRADKRPQLAESYRGYARHPLAPSN
jgi:hypothetical protein